MAPWWLIPRSYFDHHDTKTQRDESMWKSGNQAIGAATSSSRKDRPTATGASCPQHSASRLHVLHLDVIQSRNPAKGSVTTHKAGAIREGGGDNPCIVLAKLVSSSSTALPSLRPGAIPQERLHRRFQFAGRQCGTVPNDAANGLRKGFLRLFLTLEQLVGVGLKSGLRRHDTQSMHGLRVRSSSGEASQGSALKLAAA